MRSLIRPGRRRPAARAALLAATAGAVLCLAITACSSGGPGQAAHSRSPAAGHSAAPSQPATGPAAAAAVKAMWQTFFNGTVPIPRRLGLLQNSGQFASFVKSEAKTSLGALVLAASAKVSSVSLSSPGHALVTFTVLLGGRPLAKNLTGTAVYAGGRWEVAASTFCGLLRQAYGKKLRALPAACGS